MYFFYPPLQECLQRNFCVVQGDLYKHFASLRVKIKEKVYLTDLQGYLVKGQVQSLDKKKQSLTLTILEVYQQPYLSDVLLPLGQKQEVKCRKAKILFQALLSKIYLDKLFEVIPLAFDEIYFFAAQHSSTQEKINQKRLERILIRSCEQAQRVWQPKIFWLKDLDEVVTLIEEKKEKFGDLLVLDTWPVENKKEAPKSNTILVGPEGGLSFAERNFLLEKGFSFLNLGSLVYPSWLCGLVGIYQIQGLESPNLNC